MTEDATPRLLYHNRGAFLKALKELRMCGGPKQQAAEQVSQIIGDFSTEGKTLKRLTHYGEARIPHCVKYDLRGACRLVTVQDKGQIWLLFVGDHSDTDRWLDARIVVLPPPVTALSLHAKNALLFYFEAQVYSRLKTRRHVRDAFEFWIQQPANLHQLRISKLFAGKDVRRDLANEIDSFLRPHRFSLIWDC
jgi:hypothetical protein